MPDQQEPLSTGEERMAQLVKEAELERGNSGEERMAQLVKEAELERGNSEEEAERAAEVHVDKHKHDEPNPNT